MYASGMGFARPASGVKDVTASLGRDTGVSPVQFASNTKGFWFAGSFWGESGSHGRDARVTVGAFRDCSPPSPLPSPRGVPAGEGISANARIIAGSRPRE